MKYAKKSKLSGYDPIIKSLIHIYVLETIQKTNPHLFLSAFIIVPINAIKDIKPDKRFQGLLSQEITELNT